ncbi:retrovirus-related pol polyprotein from transposon TNT 1-94 [Tanacetum coccineum]
MTGVKSYLHKYVEQPGPKVVFSDNSSCVTEGYGSINCKGIVFTKVTLNGLKYNLNSISQLCDAKYIVQFDDNQGTIFNANKEIIMIAPRRNYAYILDMTPLSPNGACFFAKASESVNWLWHKRLSHLNFKNINKLAKQNKVLGLPSLVYSKDKPCTACEKGKHHRASFKTKQNFSIRKCLHLIHMNLFGPVSLMSINHEKYTLVIVDEYSRYTWVHFLRKKSQAPKMIMSFIRMVENQNDVKVKQIRIDNGTEFRNHELESFCDEKGISQNFSSPYTPEQNAFRVFNTRRQQIKETCHVTFNESIKAIRQYQVDYDVSYYIIPHGRSLTEFTQENHVPEVIVPNEPDIPQTEDTEGPPDLINIEGTHEQNVQNDQMITQPTNVSLGNDTKVSGFITEPLVPDVTQSHISNQAATSMLTKSMAAKLTVASASEYLFADFLFEREPKRNKKDEHGITTKNKARLVAQGYSQEEGIDYDKTFAPLARMEAIRIFLAFATYMNFKVYKMDVKSAFLNGKLKEEVYVKQPPGFESSEFPDYVYKLDKALYGLKQTPRAWNLLNETSYKGMIGSLMYLTATRPDIQFFTVLCVRYLSNPKDSHLTAVKRILMYLKEKAPQWSIKTSSESFGALLLPMTLFHQLMSLKEFLIKFLVLNGQRPLTLDFNTFCLSTDLDYNNGKYVDHPTPEVVKKELGKIAINPSYLDKTPILKNSFHVAWRILFTFVIQVLGGNYSSTKQVNSIQQLLAYSLITETEVDIEEIIYSDLITKLLNKSRLKYVSYPRFISCALEVLLEKVKEVSDCNFNLTKSQGPEALGAFSKKSKRPKSKKPPTETKVTPPKPTEGSEQFHSVPTQSPQAPYLIPKI